MNKLTIIFKKKSFTIALGLAFSAILLIQGCVSQRDIEYLQLKGNASKSFKDAEIADYRVKINDELYIRVSSLDAETSSLFNTMGGNTDNSFAGSMQPYGASLVSYTVGKDGTVRLPIIGNIQVKEKTLNQIGAIIKDSLNNILSQPIVTVKLVNRYVSVIGEVRNPGNFPYAQEKLTVFDALSLAGDLTIYSNRKEVMLTRNEGGKNTLVTLNLTDPEILGSSYYYVRPNDIIYVKPMKKRKWGLSEFPFATTLSAISTAILVYSVIK
jgi:polysaccharide export outer membrane protein